MSAWLLGVGLAMADIAPPGPGTGPPPPVFVDPSKAPLPVEQTAEQTGEQAGEQAPADDWEEPEGEVGIPGLTPGPPPTDDRIDPLAREIGAGLRCPVCQGLSVADSTSNAAVLMQRRIRELVAQGYTKQEIEDYFVGRYGEWVLLFPRAAGMNRLVWIGPLLATGLGLLIATTFLRGGRSASPTVATPDRADPYVDRLLREVDDE